jgi:hypothetical protein
MMRKKRTNRPHEVHESLGGGMRSCTIFQRKTGYLKRASTLAYGKYVAEPGDIVAWCEEPDGPTRHMGRVIGTVDSPPRRTGNPDYDAEAVKGWLCVMRFDPDLTHAYPVWVDPDMVTKAESCPKGNLIAFLLSDEFHELTVDDLLFLSRYGSLSESYIENRHKVLDEREERAKEEGWKP